MLTSSSGISGDIRVMLNLTYLIALPILTDRGLHWVKKLKQTNTKLLHVKYGGILWILLNIKNVVKSV
jgi:hypothetical protein